MSGGVILGEGLNFINLIKPTIGGVGALVKAIIGISSSIAFGVILFTLILKFATLPFDFISKRSMRKNSLLMEKMRPELEKLQKQYANDKMLYNQKMQALYKKNGYSMAGACLPTIITLIVFIIAINGFTTFANYQNQHYFYDMSVSYNQAFYDGLVYTSDDKEIVYGDYIVVDENKEGEITRFELDNEILNLDAYKNAAINERINIPSSKTDASTVSSFYLIKSQETQGESVVDYAYLLTEDSYIAIKYTVFEGKLSDKTPVVIANKLNGVTVNGTEYQENADSATPEEDAKNFIKDVAATYSYDRYMGNGNSFLWIRNIWVTDSPMSHPIISNYNKFIKTYGYKNTDMSGVMDEASYNNLISKLGDEAKEPNGYFILVILTAVSSLLMQIITSKSQKAQMELQTVDGQGAKSNKLMTWLMPIMMAVFAFTMTAAFSIYMITSSVFGIITTLIINKIVDKSLKKKQFETVEVVDKKEIVRGRIYVKEEPAPEPKKKKKSKKEEERVDFLNDKKENKKIRGKLK